MDCEVLSVIIKTLQIKKATLKKRPFQILKFNLELCNHVVDLSNELVRSFLLKKVVFTETDVLFEKARKKMIFLKIDCKLG